MADRLDFLETHGVKRPPEESKPEEEAFCYPVLARYDFAGKGPRPGISTDKRLYQQAALLTTRGERLGKILIRITWILVRIAIGFAILFFFFYGRTFNCGGAEISFG